MNAPAAARKAPDVAALPGASISVRNLSVTYTNGFTAVRDASFELDPGTICALVGVNGSGKSTIFKAIMGFVQPSSGEVRLCGLPVEEALKKNIVAYVPQSEDVDWNFPVLVETVVMMGRYGHMNFLRMPSRADRYKVDQALERVGMSDYRARQIGELSGGQKKRVFLARALAQEGRIILLDEPFTGIDVKTEAAIIGLLRELRASGHLMLVSTHNLGSVPDFCDQVVLLNRKVLAAGPDGRSVHAGQSRARLRRRAAQFPARRRGVARRRRRAQRHGADRRRAAARVLRRQAEPAQRPRRREMSAFLTELLVPFSYSYMLKAMWVSALVGGVCAFLSAYLMLKGWSLMGDALAHSIVPGVAAAYIVGAPFAVGAFVAGILASVGMNFVKQQTRLREDAVIGLVFTALFALGLLMASIWPTSVIIQTIVLGNILAISDEDVVQVAIIAAVSLAILAFLWKDLMVTFFDENHARTIGLNTTLLKGRVLHPAQRLHGGGVADRRRLPGDRDGGDAGRDRLSAHRPFRPADPDQHRARRDHEFCRRLYQFFPRRRDRRHDRHACRRCCSSRPSISRPSTACWRRGAGAAADGDAEAAA